MNNSSPEQDHQSFIDSVVTHTITYQRRTSPVERNRLNSAKRNSTSGDYYKRLNSGKLKQNRMQRVDQLKSVRMSDIMLMTEED